jgi:virulence factor Mce-like protein
MPRRHLVRAIRLALLGVVVLAVTPFLRGLLVDDMVPYRVELADATGLVPRNDVRLNDVIVGRVTSVHLDGLAAEVGIEVDPDEELPAETEAQVRQTSLLGEQFIELIPKGTGQLARHATIPLERTGRGQDLETLVGLGGRLAAEVNVDNLNRVLAATERGIGPDPARLHRFFDTSAEAADALAATREDLGRAIDSVDAMAARLARDADTYAQAIGRFAAGAEALARSNDQIPGVVDNVQRLSVELSGLLDRNQSSMVRAFAQTVPLLGEVVANLDDLRSIVTGLPGFNRGWACASDGQYLNFVFPLTPELATVDINPGKCDNVEAGPAGRSRPGQVHVDTPGATIEDPVGTGDLDVGAGSANGNAGRSGGGLAEMLAGVAARAGEGGEG